MADDMHLMSTFEPALPCVVDQYLAYTQLTTNPGMMNTVKLAIHHNKTRQADTSIVVTASASSFQRFPVPDYGMHPCLPNSPIIYPLLNQIPQQQQPNTQPWASCVLSPTCPSASMPSRHPGPPRTSCIKTRWKPSVYRCSRRMWLPGRWQC